MWVRWEIEDRSSFEHRVFMQVRSYRHIADQSEAQKAEDFTDDGSYAQFAEEFMALPVGSEKNRNQASERFARKADG